jgi:hypothetical protein
MSYGKEDGHLTRIGGYGASTSQQMGNATRRQSGPRKGSPAWANNFQPSEGTPDYIRLIPGEFEAERIDETTGNSFLETVPWLEYTEHYHGGNKQSMTCSAGVYRMADRKKAKPCRGCDIWREDFEERRRIENQTGVKPKNPNRISFSSKYAFLVLDMAWFFRGYRMDEHGRVNVNKTTGQPYQDWIKYNEQHHNEYLYASGEAQRQGKQLEMKQGQVLTWPVGFTQFGTLSGFGDVVQKHCSSCGGQSCIHTVGWACPTCNAPTMNTTLPPDEVKKLVSRTVHCNHCHTVAYPKAIQTCQYCQNPTPANLYSIDMQVQTVRVQDKKQIIIPWMSNPRPMDPTYAEALKKLPDAVKKFAPTPYEEQVSKFGPPPQANYGQVQPPQQGWQQPGQAPQQQWPQQGYQPQQSYPQPPQAQTWGQPPAPQQTWQPQPQQAWQPQQQWQPQQAPQQGWQPQQQPWGGGYTH